MQVLSPHLLWPVRGLVSERGSRWLQNDSSPVPIHSTPCPHHPDSLCMIHPQGAMGMTPPNSSENRDPQGSSPLPVLPSSFSWFSVAFREASSVQPSLGSPGISRVLGCVQEKCCVRSDLHLQTQREGNQCVCMCVFIHSFIPQIVTQPLLALYQLLGVLQ